MARIDQPLRQIEPRRHSPCRLCRHLRRNRREDSGRSNPTALSGRVKSPRAKIYDSRGAATSRMTMAMTPLPACFSLHRPAPMAKPSRPAHALPHCAPPPVFAAPPAVPLPAHHAAPPRRSRSGTSRRHDSPSASWRSTNWICSTIKLLAADRRQRSPRRGSPRPPPIDQPVRRSLSVAVRAGHPGNASVVANASAKRFAATLRLDVELTQHKLPAITQPWPTRQAAHPRGSTVRRTAGTAACSIVPSNRYASFS
jgi:hypothetical protein